jgi:thioesterase domain-containing protein
MTDTAALCDNLQTLWHEHFPLSKAMDVQVVSFTDHVLTTRTRLAPNTNIHNSAFAGSLYAIESLTAWGVLYLELEQAGFDASIIHARGNIEFDAPVRDDIIAVSDFSGQEHIFEVLRRTGKARLSLATEVFPASQPPDGSAASHFEGLYVVRLNAHQ